VNLRGKRKGENSVLSTCCTRERPCQDSSHTKARRACQTPPGFPPEGDVPSPAVKILRRTSKNPVSKTREGRKDTASHLNNRGDPLATIVVDLAQRLLEGCRNGNDHNGVVGSRRNRDGLVVSNGRLLDECNAALGGLLAVESHILAVKEHLNDGIREGGKPVMLVVTGLKDRLQVSETGCERAGLLLPLLARTKGVIEKVAEFIGVVLLEVGFELGDGGTVDVVQNVGLTCKEGEGKDKRTTFPARIRTCP
jgi:hypothetical protein